MKTADLQRGGISIKEHSLIHQWLRKTYGNANHCEFCKKSGLKYNYAKKKDSIYEKKIDNYMQLCTSCHRLYDLTDEIRDKLLNQLPSQKGKNGKLHPTSKRIIDTETGFIFDTVSDAAEVANLKLSTLSMMLTGKNKNRTTLKYYEN